MRDSSRPDEWEESPIGAQTKFILIGLAFAVTIAFMVVVATSSEGGLYYLTVTEYVNAPDRDEANFRVNGKVVDGSIVRDPSGERVEFHMSDGQSVLAVDFEGIIPDTFVDGADVVVRGEMADETFHADELLAKCPSKYEAADEAQQPLRDES